MSFKQQEPSDIWNGGTLAEFIDKASIFCDQCNYPEEICEWLLRDAIIIGLWSKEAYFKCTEKSSNLTLKQAIEIAENEEAMSSQVSNILSEFESNTSQAVVNKLHGNRGGAQAQVATKAAKGMFY